MSKKGPWKYRDLLKRLKQFGVFEDPVTKATSVRFLGRVVDSNGKGPFYPVGVKGEGVEIEWPVIKAILRRFDIQQNEFLDE